MPKNPDGGPIGPLDINTDGANEGGQNGAASTSEKRGPGRSPDPRSPHGASGATTIVNPASVAGLVGAPTQPIYAASKHAVVGMTKTAAAEYARSGIRINSVCPGIVNTPMMARALEREPLREKKLRNVHPLGRFGEPSEVANAAMWLCSDQSSFVTGHQLAVDGGLTAI